MCDLPVYALIGLGAWAEMSDFAMIAVEAFTAMLRPDHAARIDDLGNVAVTITQAIESS
jgi:hypothetical protein